MAEKADITMDEARALVSDTALWPLMRDFLWDFSAQVHRSWIEGLELLAPLNLDSQSILENPRVKRFVLERLGVEPCMHTFPKDDWSRLLLLGGDTLIAIAKWLGALACADALRRVTDDKVVRELNEREHVTVILITHNTAITPMADHILEMKSGKIVRDVYNEHPKAISEIEW